MRNIMKSTKLFVAILCIFMLCSGIVLDAVINLKLVKNTAGNNLYTVNNNGNINTYRAVSAEIAVVNLDEGVRTGQKTAYYAQKLITLPNEHFHMTGLDDARNGLEAGNYGAYIVIPATFSRAVESINNEPEKATITYTVNADNNASSLASVVNDINTFASAVGENITFIYVSAILDEYHTAQDNTKTILKNDSADLNNLNSVSAESLLGEYKYVKEGDADYNPADIDMNKYEIDNENIIDTFSMDLKNAIDENEEDFDNIKSEGESLKESTGRLQRLLEEMEPLKDADGSSIYTEGLNNIRGLFTGYGERLNSSFSMFSEIFSRQNEQTKNTLASESNVHLASESNALFAGKARYSL